MKKKSDKEILETFPKQYVTDSSLEFDERPVVITDDNIAYWHNYFKKTDVTWQSGDKIVEHPNFTPNIILRRKPNGSCLYIYIDQLYNHPETYELYHKAINYIIIDY